ncbi:MAG: hypothetical protein AAF490_30560 [Chloroflexota bacterium]
MDNQENWEYCEIKLLVIHDGKGNDSGAPPNFWFQFFASAQSANKSYVAGRSEKIPYPSHGLIAKDPKPIQSRDQNLLNMLFQELEQDGWESLGQKGASWWEHQFRRPEQPKKSFMSKVKSLLSIT